MNPKKQRIAIAQACGWTDIGFAYFSGTGLDPLDGLRDDLPDYLNDLNAMHEAEKMLTNDQKTDFIRAVNKGDFSNRRLAFATAAQRAEAFLRTLNLWTE
jgi:hypothetical protein